jgi:uncharacterized protein YciI
MTRKSLGALAIVLVLACSAAATQNTTSANAFAVRFQPGAAWDKSKTPADQMGFASHSANLQRLRKEGRIVLGGRFADLGLIVVTASNLAAARELFASDETIAGKVFTIQIDPWSTIFDGCVKR